MDGLSDPRNLGDQLTASIFYTIDPTSTPQVRSYSGTTIATVGTSFGVSDDNSTLGTAFYGMPGNSVIPFQRPSTFLALTGGVIYRSTDTGASWSAVRTMSNLYATAQGAHSGFHVYRGTVWVSYLNASNQAYTDWSTDGVNWTTVGPLTFNSPPATVNYKVITDYSFLNGVGYCSVWNGTTSSADGRQDIIMFDPVARTQSSLQSGEQESTILAPTLCAYNGTMYMLWHQAFSGNVDLSTISASGVGTIVVTGFQAYATLGTASAKWSLFTSGGYLWAVTFTGGAVYHCDRFDPAVIRVASDSSIPASMTTATARLSSYKDINGTNPNDQYVYYTADGASGTTVIGNTFNGTSVMTTIGTITGSKATDLLSINHDVQVIYSTVRGTTAAYQPSANSTATSQGNPRVLLDKITSSGPTISLSTAETTTYSYSIPANTLGSSNRLRLVMHGTLKTKSTSAGTYTVKVKVGATTLTAVNAATLTDNIATPAPISISCDIVESGLITNSQVITSVVLEPTLTVVTTRTARATAAIDGTAAIAFSVLWQFGTSDADNIFTVDSVFLEVMQ